MRIFKIRNPEGLFSTGGSSPKWSPKGKTWVALNHLRAHLSLIRNERERFITRMKVPMIAERYEATRRYADFDKSKDPYVGCMIVVYETAVVNEKPIIEGSMELC